MNLKNALFIAILMVFCFCFVSGCISNLSDDNDSLESENNRTESVDTNGSTEEPTTTEENTPSFFIPNAYAKGEGFDYMDDARNNHIRVTIEKNSGQFLDSYYYYEDSTKKKVIITPEEGMKYYVVFVHYYHEGLAVAEQPSNITTASIAFHRLRDSDGNVYRPLHLNQWGPITSIRGDYYLPTTLGRLEDMRGYLIYEVPETFIEDGSYITIKLGKWGTPAWKLGA